MKRRSAVRHLALWMNGSRVGTWVTAPGQEELHYASEWIASAQGRPLSLSLPFIPGNPPHKGPAVRAWFENLLPDSQAIRERLARRFRAATTDAPDLLEQLGRDCVGALQILPEGEAPGDLGHMDAEPLSEGDVARLLRATVAPASAAGLQAEIEDLRISVAGAQEKTALLWHEGQCWRPRGATPTTHLLKLPMGLVANGQLGFRQSLENEWLCAQILNAFELPVARCHPLRFEDQAVLGVERFDRRWSPTGRHWLRLPQEDFCQATGTPPHLKYEADGGPGMDRILGLLGQSANRLQDKQTFFKALLIFWMLRAPDGHAKNFSIALQPGGGYALTPLYDVMSAHPLLGKGAGQWAPQRIRQAMAVRTTNAHWQMEAITRRHWEAVGRRNGVVSSEGRDVGKLIESLVEATPAVVETLYWQLPAGFPAQVADSILHGLLRASRRLGTKAGTRA